MSHTQRVTEHAARLNLLCGGLLRTTMSVTSETVSKLKVTPKGQLNYERERFGENGVEVRKAISCIIAHLRVSLSVTLAATLQFGLVELFLLDLEPVKQLSEKGALIFWL